MRAYILKRALLVLPTLVGVSIVVFFAVNSTPSNAVDLILGVEVTAEDRQELFERLGLDDPTVVRYFKWLYGIFKGDFGDSWLRGRPVVDLILDTLTNTAYLTLTSLAIVVIMGIGIGTVAGLYPNSLIDRAVMVFALMGVSLPVFWFGIILVWLFAVQLDALPPAGRVSPTEGGDFVDILRHLALPAVTLATPNVAIVARLTRSSMLEVMEAEFIRTARAKGLSEMRVVATHAMKNALIPVVTVIGYQLGLLLSGSVIVESVFGWPGIGRLMLDAVLTRDFPLVQGITVFLAALFLLANLLVDISYSYLDPRIKQT